MSSPAWSALEGAWLTTSGQWANVTLDELAADPISATLAHLTATGLRVYDGRPTVTPPGPYLVVELDYVADSPWHYDAAPEQDAISIRVMAVSRYRAICRDTAKTADRAINNWRPTPDLSTAAWRRVDSGPMLTDGPPSDIRHSLTTIYRAHVPR